MAISKEMKDEIRVMMQDLKKIEHRMVYMSMDLGGDHPILASLANQMYLSVTRSITFGERLLLE